MVFTCGFFFLSVCRCEVQINFLFTTDMILLPLLSRHSRWQIPLVAPDASSARLLDNLTHLSALVIPCSI